MFREIKQMWLEEHFKYLKSWFLNSVGLGVLGSKKNTKVVLANLFTFSLLNFLFVCFYFYIIFYQTKVLST